MNLAGGPLRLSFHAAGRLLLRHRVLEGGLLNSALGHAHGVAALLLGGAHTELLFLMIAAEALRVLVEAREAAALLIGSDALHFDDLSAGQYVLELDGRALILLILDDFFDVLLHYIYLATSSFSCASHG